MKMHRLLRRGRSIFVICLVGLALSGTCISHALAQTFTPGTSQLGGWVYIDRNNDGNLAWATDPKPEFVIPSVEVKLFSIIGSQESLVSTTTTDAYGRYFFNTLTPGTYTIRQTQPVEYVNGLSTVGTFQSLVGASAKAKVATTATEVPSTPGSGTGSSNEFSSIVLPVNTRGDFYNFGELGMTAFSASKRFLLTSTPPMLVTEPPPFENAVPEPSTMILLVAATACSCLPRRRRRSKQGDARLPDFLTP